jgi:hypothetical protein
MGFQEKKATIISFVAIVAFMAIVAGAENIPGFVNEKKMNLLADAADVVAPGASVPATSTASVIVTKASTTATVTAFNPAPPRPPSLPPVVTTSTPPPAPTPTPATTTPQAPATTTRALPYSVGTFGNYFVDGDGWTAQAGVVSQNDGLLTVSAGSSTTIGNALLDGSDGWSNYRFSATVDWVKGETFGLMARYIDPKDFLACEFDEQKVGTVEVSFKKYVNGAATTLATKNVIDYEQMGGDGIDAMIAVDGNDGICSFNGRQVYTFDIGPAGTPQQGGVGFTTWNPAMDDSEIVIHNVGIMDGLYGLSP